MSEENEDLKGIGAAPEEAPVVYEVTEEEKEQVENYVQESIKNKVFAINGFKIKEKYPKAWEKFKQDVLNKVNPALINKNSPEDIVHSALLYSARIILPEFFDQHGIFMNIRGGKEAWRYTMEIGEVHNISSPPSKTRIEAEAFGYEAAFIELEKIS